MEKPVLNFSCFLNSLEKLNGAKATYSPNRDDSDLEPVLKTPRVMAGTLFSLTPLTSYWLLLMPQIHSMLLVQTESNFISQTETDFNKLSRPEIGMSCYYCCLHAIFPHLFGRGGVRVLIFL